MAGRPGGICQFKGGICRRCRGIDKQVEEIRIIVQTSLQVDLRFFALILNFLPLRCLLKLSQTVFFCCGKSPRTSTVAGIYLVVESDSWSPATTAVLENCPVVKLRSQFLTCLV